MIKNLVANLKSNKNVKNTALVGVATVIGAFFSYVLQLFLGRTLSVEDFGSFNALLSISYLIAVPASVFSLSLVKAVSELSSKEEYGGLTLLFRRLFGLCFSIGIFVFLLIFFSKTRISTNLQINDPNSVALFGALMGLSFFNVIIPGYLQGLQKYKSFSVFTIISTLLRLVFPVIAVIFGARLGGVFGGMSLGIVVTFCISYFFISDMFSDPSNLEIKSTVRKIFYFSLPVLFVNFGMMVLNNIDLIIVKRFFDPVVAGHYAGTVTLGKILLFGCSVVATVMFPQISAMYTRNENYNKRFKEFLVLEVLAVFVGVLVYWLVPGFLTKLFFGERFINSVQYLAPFASFIGLYVLINFLVLYFLAIEKTQVVFLLLPGVIAQVFLLSKYHTSIFQVININISVCIITLVLLIAFYYVDLLVWQKRR